MHSLIWPVGGVVERSYVVQNGRVLEYDYLYVGIICWPGGDYNFDGWFGYIHWNYLPIWLFH